MFSLRPATPTARLDAASTRPFAFAELSWSASFKGRSINGRAIFLWGQRLTAGRRGISTTMMPPRPPEAS